MTSIPVDVQKFISEHIFTIERLDILLRLAEHPDKEWTVREVCTAFNIPPAIAIMRLTGLKTSDLVASRAAEETLYRYAPATPALRDTARRMMEMCRTLPRMDLAQMIYGRP